jgi:hypothetical protein
VCNKEDCRSWNHTEEEREESKAKFRNANKDKFARFDNKFNRRLDQYIADYEGDDIDSEEELEEAFQSLTIDIDPGHLDKDPQDGIDHFFTSFGQIQRNQATSMAADLANKAFSHSVTTDDITVSLVTDQDPFSYNTTVSRYSIDN